MKLNQIKHLLSPDATEGSAVDPLSEAAGGVDTSFPVLSPDRLLRFEVKNATRERNDKTGAESIKLKLRLTDDTQNASATYTDGKPARAGYTVSQYIGITPTDKYSIDDIKRNAALWIKAIWGEEAAKGITFRAFFDQPSMAEARKVDCKTGINKDKNGVYPDSTKLTPVLPA